MLRTRSPSGWRSARSTPSSPAPWWARAAILWASRPTPAPRTRAGRGTSPAAPWRGRPAGPAAPYGSRARDRAHDLLRQVLLLVVQHAHLAALQLRVVLEIDLEPEALFELREAPRLGLDEVERHVGRHLYRDAPVAAERRDAAQGALELDEHGLVARHLAEAAAGRAVLGVVVEQGRAL